jgi:hypothetical protein
MRALIADLATTLQATIEKAEAARAYYWANCDPQYPPVQSFLATIADGSTFFDSGLAFGSLLAHEMVVALAGASQPGAVTHGFPLSRQWLAAYERWQTHEGAEGANIRVLTK